MRNMLLVVIVLVVGIALSAAVGQSAQAQEPVPVVVPSCQDMARYDLNRDGRVSGDDFSLWVITVHELGGAACQLNGPASGCPAWLDVNHDGVISTADLDAMSLFRANCVWPSRSVRQ